MPTYLPTRAPEGTRAGRLLASLAIVLAMVLLIEMTIKTPPLAGEITFGSVVEKSARGF